MRTDEELLAGWQAGDLSAGNELFRRHFEAVRRFFANKVDDEGEVEELVQQTFATCVAVVSRFEARSSFRTYLLGIARNRLMKHWEARARPRPEPIDAFAVADLGAGPSSVLARGEQQRRLLDALRRIPLRDQLVIELYYFEDLSGPELGVALGISERAARTRLHRAKAALAKQLHRLEQLAGTPDSTETDLERWARELRSQLLPPDEGPAT